MAQHRKAAAIKTWRNSARVNNKTHPQNGAAKTSWRQWHRCAREGKWKSRIQTSTCVARGMANSIAQSVIISAAWRAAKALVARRVSALLPHAETAIIKHRSSGIEGHRAQMHLAAPRVAAQRRASRNVARGSARTRVAARRGAKACGNIAARRIAANV